MALRRGFTAPFGRLVKFGRGAGILAGPSEQLTQHLLSPRPRSNSRVFWEREPQVVFQTRELGKFVHPDDIMESRLCLRHHRCWTAREYTPEFVGSTFVVSDKNTKKKTLSYGPSAFAHKGAALQWWGKKGSQYHVTKFCNEPACRNGGFGFHITPLSKKKVHYYFNRDGHWIETTPGNPRIKPPAKVQDVADAFAAMRRTYKRSKP